MLLRFRTSEERGSFAETVARELSARLRLLHAQPEVAAMRDLSAEDVERIAEILDRFPGAKSYDDVRFDVATRTGRRR